MRLRKVAFETDAPPARTPSLPGTERNRFDNPETTELGTVLGRMRHASSGVNAPSAMVAAEVNAACGSSSTVEDHLVRWSLISNTPDAGIED